MHGRHIMPISRGGTAEWWKYILWLPSSRCNPIDRNRLLFATLSYLSFVGHWTNHKKVVSFAAFSASPLQVDRRFAIGG